MGFKRYVGKRLVTMVFVVLFMMTFIFLVINVIPGDPVLNMVGEDAPQEVVEAIRRDLGLDAPLHIQYFDYLTGLLRGDFGRSFVLGEDVSVLIWQRAGVTIQLAILAWIFSVAIGILVGRRNARLEGTTEDHVTRLTTLFFYAIPSYVLGILAQLVFGVYLGVLPIFGTSSPGVRPPKITGMILIDALITLDFGAFINAFMHFLLPSLVLASGYAAVTIRLTRSETIQAMKRSYCLLAEAKGISQKEVVNRHAFRNALLPVVTLTAMQAGALLTGSVLIEAIFSLNGLGNLLFTAASMRDYILTQGVVTLFVVINAVVGLFIDISYYYLDPRMRF
ncbi:MAG: ABC transporter permease [Candidatus Thorarchaeota archaeon]